MEVLMESNVQLNHSTVNDTLMEFNLIIQCVINSDNEDELRKSVNHLRDNVGLDYFYYGFGSSHFWVKQRNYDKRILFCELN